MNSIAKFNLLNAIENEVKKKYWRSIVWFNDSIFVPSSTRTASYKASHFSKSEFDSLQIYVCVCVPVSHALTNGFHYEWNFVFLLNFYAFDIFSLSLYVCVDRLLGLVPTNCRCWYVPYSIRRFVFRVFSSRFFWNPTIRITFCMLIGWMVRWHVSSVIDVNYQF